MTDRIKELVSQIDYWSSCMSYNDSYFGEPPGLLKRNIRQLMKELDKESDERKDERLRAMELANQITDPNIRLPIKYILENMK